MAIRGNGSSEDAAWKLSRPFHKKMDGLISPAASRKAERSAGHVDSLDRKLAGRLSGSVELAALNQKSRPLNDGCVSAVMDHAETAYGDRAIFGKPFLEWYSAPFGRYGDLVPWMLRWRGGVTGQWVVAPVIWTPDRGVGVEGPGLWARVKKGAPSEHTIERTRIRAEQDAHAAVARELQGTLATEAGRLEEAVREVSRLEAQVPCRTEALEQACADRDELAPRVADLRLQLTSRIEVVERTTLQLEAVDHAAKGAALVDWLATADHPSRAATVQDLKDEHLELDTLHRALEMELAAADEWLGKIKSRVGVNVSLRKLQFEHLLSEASPEQSAAVFADAKARKKGLTGLAPLVVRDVPPEVQRYVPGQKSKTIVCELPDWAAGSARAYADELKTSTAALAATRQEYKQDLYGRLKEGLENITTRRHALQRAIQKLDGQSSAERVRDMLDGTPVLRQTAAEVYRERQLRRVEGSGYLDEALRALDPGQEARPAAQVTKASHRGNQRKKSKESGSRS